MNNVHRIFQLPNIPVIGVYNNSMGGTDKFDQLNSYYDGRLRTKKWQIRIYNHFLRAAVVNACVLYNSKQAKPIPLMTYILTIVKEWCNVQKVPTLNNDQMEIELPSKKRKIWSFGTNLMHFAPMDAMYQSRLNSKQRQMVSEKTHVGGAKCVERKQGSNAPLAMSHCAFPKSLKNPAGITSIPSKIWNK